MLCIICRKALGNSITIKKPYLTHLDFDHYKTTKKNKIFYCKNCNHAFRNFTLNNNSLLFKSEKYINHSEDHKYFYKKKLIKQKKLQAQIIKKHLIDKKDLNVLDYGCFDGGLLNELLKYKSVKNAIGYDVSNRNITNKKIIFYTNLKKINYRIDIVIFANSIIYEKNLHSKLRFINTIIHNDTKFFIQIPDYVNRPILFSLVDQNHFFSRDSIKNFFFLHKIYLREIKSTVIKNDLIFISSKKNNHLNKNSILKKFEFNKLDKKINKLNKLLNKFKNTRNFIFGSTIYASYFSYYFRNFIGFIDEDLSKIDKPFLNKKIYNIKEIKKNNSFCFVFDDNKKLKNRLKKLYGYKIICI